MNPSRLVAAVAALAIGFGVTIVGVNVADEPDDVIATVDSDGPEPSGDEATDDAEAEQDEAAAEPPPDAEVAAETSPVNSEPASEPAPPASSSDRDSGSEPGGQAACEAVLVVFTGSGETLILSVERGEVEEVAGEFFVRGSGLTIEEQFRTREAELIFGVLDDRSGGRTVEDCESGEIYDATVRVDFEGVDDESVSGEASDDVETVAGGRFPCSDSAFDGLLDGLGDLEQTALASDADVFVRVIARRLARFGTSSVDAWEADVRDAFDRFVEGDGCSTELEEIFVEGEAAGEFFCAAANVSADDRLFVLLDGAVPNQMEGCQYDPEEGVN